MTRVTGLVALAGVVAMAARPALAQQKGPFAGLDAYVEPAMRTWKVPGLGLAVVRNDSVIYTKGYGMRDVGKPDGRRAHAVRHRLVVEGVHRRRSWR